jgi:peptide/nickel transport system permease protein
MDDDLKTIVVKHGLISRLFSVIGRFTGWRTGFMISGMIIILMFVFIAITAPLLTPFDPTKGSSDVLQPPFTYIHIFGTDNLGRDIFARIVYGTRTILSILLLSTLISITIGMPLGLVSGFFSGVIDRILSIVMDSIYAFPSLLLAIVIALMLGPSPLNTAISIAFVYIPTYYRMIRGQTLSIKAQLYIEAAIASGTRTRKILIKHILPNLLPTLVVIFSLSAADAILTEAGLSYLGYSVTPPTPDWGYDLYVGREYVLSGYWWLSFFPGLMVVLLSVGFALVGEALSDIYNPRR